MLHLLAGGEVILTDWDFRPLTDLVSATEGRECRVRQVDTFVGELLLNTDQVAFALVVQRPDSFEMRRSFFIALSCWYFTVAAADDTTNGIARDAKGLCNGPHAMPLGMQTQDSDAGVTIERLSSF